MRESSLNKVETVTVVLLSDHEDSKRPDYSKPFNWCFDTKGNKFLLHKHKTDGSFLAYNDGKRTRATKGYFRDAPTAVEHISEFSKALGLSLALFAPMLASGGVL